MTGADADPARVDDWRTRTGRQPVLPRRARPARHDAPAAGAARCPSRCRRCSPDGSTDLPDATREVLLVSAALGREHSPLLLAHVGGWGPDEVTDRLEPAHEVGIVHQRDDGRLVFEHALTRDAVLAAVVAGSPRAGARPHRPRPGRRVPRGSLGTGRARVRPGAPLAGRRPGARAAGLAGRRPRRRPRRGATSRTSRPPSSTGPALDAHALDPAGTREERYELLLSFSEAAAWAAKWRPVVEAVVEAVALARADDDPERVARAAAELTRYSVWLPQEHDEVDEDLVDDLRAVLRGLDHHDSPVRCVLMLALAVQLYYRPGVGARGRSRSSTRAPRRPDASATRRCGGGRRAPAWLALWRSAHLERRHALAVEELAAARESGDEAARPLGHIALAGTGLEEGDLETWRAESAAAEAIARRRRLVYVEFVLHFVRLNLALLEGDDEAADAHADAMRTMRDGMATPAMEWTDFGVSYVTAMWRPEVAGRWPRRCSSSHRRTPPRLRPRAAAPRARARRAGGRRARRARPCAPSRRWPTTGTSPPRPGCAPSSPRSSTTWRSPAAWSTCCARPTGGWRSPGISVVSGPVDGYLALALAVSGEREEATVLADRAEALASRWGMTAYLRWLAERTAVATLGQVLGRSCRRLDASDRAVTGPRRRRSGRPAPRPARTGAGPGRAARRYGAAGQGEHLLPGVRRAGRASPTPR